MGDGLRHEAECYRSVLERAPDSFLRHDIRTPTSTSFGLSHFSDTPRA